MFEFLAALALAYSLAAPGDPPLPGGGYFPTQSIEGPVLPPPGHHGDPPPPGDAPTQTTSDTPIVISGG
jgi:hypothetical protein